MSRERGKLDEKTQAARIINRFGGARKLWEAMSLITCDRRATPTSYLVIYRWTYPVERRGTGGLIPAAAIHVILEAAKRFNVHLTSADWDPRERP
jgi:hypothetical protein